VRLRNSRVGRFVLEAYYELRHKVTWPTFEEARNMTIAVILLSAAVGTILWVVDEGLKYLSFLLIR
jgi:preprotein translocase SecE subunit